MIIDAHTHIFPRAIREQRERFFPSEPDFRLLYQSSDARIAGAGEIIHTMDDQGIDKSVVFGFPWKDPDVFKMHNDYILNAVSRFPERLLGFGCFDALHPDAPNEAQRCVEAGLIGIGELAFYRSGIDTPVLDRLEPVMSILLEKRLPVLIHVNEPVGHVYPGKAPIVLAGIEALLKRFPHNTIILAHWGGGIFFYHLLRKEMKSHLKNVYYDTAASPYLYDPGVYRIALEILGDDRILFGSDYPLLTPKRYFPEMKTAGITEDKYRNIIGLNAERLLCLTAATDITDGQ